MAGDENMITRESHKTMVLAIFSSAGAILSLNGEKLKVFSGKNYTLGDFIKVRKRK